MSTIGGTYLTLADHAKRLDPSGRIGQVVEMLNVANPMIEDAAFIEGNLPTGHRTNIRTGLPTVYWRLLNRGTPSSKSTTAQVDESCGMLEARSQVDEKLAKLAGDLAAFRLSEARPFAEAMSQEAASTLIYGNSATDPEEITGLANRYSSLSATNAQNIINAGGTSTGGSADNTSIWLICWGMETVHGVFPKGSQAGLVHQDLGLQDAFDEDNNRFRAYMDLWQWDLGIIVKDWRYAVRIANIDVSNLVGESSAADLSKLMIKATHRIPTFASVRPCFYVSRSVHQMLDIQKRDNVQAGGQLSYAEVDGMPVSKFRAIPVKTCDAILETEEAIS
jgi:hypothetical protein